MKKLLTSISLSVLALVSHADELIVHIGSKHTVSTYTINDTIEVKINNTNPGIGYRNDSGYAIGTYFNSYNFRTFYVTKDFMYNDYVGIVAGAVTGYKSSTGMLITPMVAGTVKIPLTKEITANILLMPKVGKLAGVAHLALSYKF